MDKDKEREIIRRSLEQEDANRKPFRFRGTGIMFTSAGLCYIAALGTFVDTSLINNYIYTIFFFTLGSFALTRAAELLEK